MKKLLGRRFLIGAMLILASQSGYSVQVEVETTVTAVMAAGNDAVIFFSGNVHNCNHQNRVAVRLNSTGSNSHMVNHAMSVALTAKTTGQTVVLYMDDVACHLYSQKEIDGIAIGKKEDTNW